MRYLRYFALLAVVMGSLAYSPAQVSVGVGIGVGPGYVAGPPVCSYGYYDYYPYACAPYGYYGSNWFADGIFIGAGPWYHWGHPAWFWNRAYVGRSWDHDGWRHEGNWGRGYNRGWTRGYAHEGYGRARAGGGYHGESGFRGGQGFHGGGSFHGGGGYHGGGGFHGGGRR